MFLQQQTKKHQTTKQIDTAESKSHLTHKTKLTEIKGTVTTAKDTAHCMIQDKDTTVSKEQLRDWQKATLQQNHCVLLPLQTHSRN